jgi:hypothetical protein
MALHWHDGGGFSHNCRHDCFTATELTMYYPVAVGGPLTKIVDGIVADFMKENPDIRLRRSMPATITMPASRPWQP